MHATEISLKFNIQSPTSYATRREYSSSDTCLVNSRIILKIPGPAYMITHSACMYGAWDGRWTLDSKAQLQFQQQSIENRERGKENSNCQKGRVHRENFLQNSWSHIHTFPKSASYFMFLYYALL